MSFPNPFSNFTNMLTDWFKDLQEYVDNLSPVPDGDNSMFPMIGIPYHFDTTVLVSATVSQFTNYIDSAHGYGYQNIGFSHRLTLINGDLRCTNLQLIGKIATGNPGTWSKLTESEQTDALDKAQQLLKVGVYNNYPNSKIGFSSYSLGSFGFTVIGHNNTDMHYKYEDKNGEHVNTLYTCSTTKTNNEITDNGDGTISGPFSDVSLGGRNFTKTTPTIVLFGNDTNAQDFVSRMQSTNRDVFNHVCVSGATYKVYVGETYLVYVIDNTKLYTFYDLYDGTKTATDKINNWLPSSPPIVVPTYDDVKNGGGVNEPDKDGEIDMPTIYMSTDTGYTHYYEFDKSDVFKVREGVSDLNNAVTTLKDVLRNLISYKIFAIPSSVLIKTKTPVIFHLAGRDIEYNGNTIPCNAIEELNEIDLGSIDVPETFMDYRDYAPYTKLEIFVPFCGWTTIPSWCMGKTITGTMYIDLMNGSCKSVIKASKTVICEMGGSCSYDVPFAAENAGAKAAAVINKVATTAGAVASGNGLAIATSGLSLVSALNANYTEMRGVCGDGSMINGLTKMYLKVTRVTCTDDNKTLRPDAYRHERGLPCGKEIELYDGMGYTQILDANVEGTMTDREKQMIIDGFRHGLIL